MRYAKSIKKRWLVLIWLLMPVALISYHFGPGQQALAWREAARLRDAAVEFEKQGHWEQAVAAYGEALHAAPSRPDDASASAAARQQLRFAQIRAGFQLGKLEETLTDLRQFIDQAETTHGAKSRLAYDARDLLGRVHYQAMIALRLESAEKEVWMKHWELSRQNFRFLAEHSAPDRNALDRKNLEVVIKSANRPTPPVPAGGGGGGGGSPKFAPPTTPPVVSEGPAPPDNRPRAPTPSTTEITPPEFELGS